MSGSFLSGIQDQKNPARPAVAIRADYDAVSTADGAARHLCGHDGHAAALCGAALAAEGHTYGRNIIFLFQPAEEIGEGAKSCLEIFEKEKIGEIYGVHNLPGFPFGQVVTKEGTFACASHGLCIRLKGTPTHAAYPENGISPAMAVGEFLCALQEIADSKKYKAMTLCTVIGVQMGEKAFGTAAADAEIWLTIRGELDCDVDMLHNGIINRGQELANEYHLGFSHQVHDVFPATENTGECARKVLDRCNGSVLEVPMRWSEDFGHYLKHCPGAFLGIGAGEDYAPLHTEHYEYPDELLQPTIGAILQLVK